VSEDIDAGLLAHDMSLPAQNIICVLDTPANHQLVEQGIRPTDFPAEAVRRLTKQDIVLFFSEADLAL